MPAPRLPASWYTAKGGVIGAITSLGVLWLAARLLGTAGVILAAPLIAVPAALAALVFLSWIAGRGQRAYRFGVGEQQVWGYLGHDIRGIVDDRGAWLSLRDCETASGLDLESALKLVPSTRRRIDDVRGLVLDMPSLTRLLDACKDDFSRVARFRTFLEREVWKIRKG